MNRGLTFDVLGYREDGEWCALALELDLRGYGETFEAAFEEMKDCVLGQIRFAVENNLLDSLFFPAEKKYFQMFRRARKRYFAALAEGRAPQPEAAPAFAAGLQLPPLHKSGARLCCAPLSTPNQQEHPR